LAREVLVLAFGLSS